MADDLKTCPFCGGKAFLSSTRPNGVWCENVGCAVMNGKTRTKAIAAWNRRPSSSALEREVVKGLTWMATKYNSACPASQINDMAREMLARLAASRDERKEEKR